VAALAPWPALGAVIFPAGALIIRTIPRLKARSKAGGGPVIGGPYSRSLPLGMMLCFLSLPVSSWFLHQGPEVIWSTAVMFILIMVRRLTAGLRADLKVGGDRKSILMKRLLYDRATTAWRR
jgi:glycerol-3-phosphate acyltransferase PlsY